MTTATPTLTAANVRALRTATDYTIHMDGAVARITLTKPAPTLPSGSPFAKSERGIDEVSHSFLAGVGGTATKGFFTDMYTPANWRALAALVKPGDRLVFNAFTNNNGYMDAAEIPAGKLEDHRFGYSKLFVDELTVTILRPAPKKPGGWRRVLDGFRLSYSITPDNLARALRPLTFSIA